MYTVITLSGHHVDSSAKQSRALSGRLFWEFSISEISEESLTARKGFALVSKLHPTLRFLHQAFTYSWQNGLAL
jgi:hypothetical protein